jgi:hypothetical protein
MLTAVTCQGKRGIRALVLSHIMLPSCVRVVRVAAIEELR